MKASTLAIALVAAAPAVAETYKGYDTPRYTVLQQAGAFEVRAYEPALMAEVTIKSSQSGALRKGFQVLAGYIFGGNVTSDKVAMTSPVAQAPSETIAMTSPVAQSGEEGLWTVGFMMPHSYDVASLPTPNNNAIQFVETAASEQVVVTFSGWASSGRLATKESELRAFADANGLTTTGPAQFLIYDDPMTAPWKRRNEVALVLE